MSCHSITRTTGQVTGVVIAGATLLAVGMGAALVIVGGALVLAVVLPILVVVQLALGRKRQPAPRRYDPRAHRSNTASGAAEHRRRMAVLLADTRHRDLIP